ncbi:MAG: response regulator [Spirochaeta sp.]|nr:response regulator [Spirochaeta sp.]
MRTELFPATPVLIIDDEEHILESLRVDLSSNGITNIICVKDSRRVLEILAKQEIWVILLDLTMPYISGEELFSIIRQDYPDLPIIIITGNTEVSTAVECMKMGAFDYLVKAVESSKLIAAVSGAIKIQELKHEIINLKKHLVSNEFEHPEVFSEIVTDNNRMRSILLYVEAIAKTAQVVLITGETGTGKELIARSIHSLSGRHGEYVVANVAGFDDNMFADTLFGHRKGAFTGADHALRGLIERAAGGTLFLDEIGDLSPLSQVKLLRLLEANEYFPLGSDVPRISAARIIASTNKDLAVEIEKGGFRKDLLYRLNTHKVYIPPLRERIDDLPILIDSFLRESAGELGKAQPTPPPELYILLETYHFPGNIRELKSMIFDAVSKHKSGKLSLEVFKTAIGKDRVPTAKSRNEPPVSFSDKLPTMKEVNELLIAEAMRRAKGNLSITAGLLGMTRQALSKRLSRKKAGSI